MARIDVFSVMAMLGELLRTDEENFPAVNVVKKESKYTGVISQLVRFWLPCPWCDSPTRHMTIHPTMPLKVVDLHDQMRMMGTMRKEELFGASDSTDRDIVESVTADKQKPRFMVREDVLLESVGIHMHNWFADKLESGNGNLSIFSGRKLEGEFGDFVHALPEFRKLQLNLHFPREVMTDVSTADDGMVTMKFKRTDVFHTVYRRKLAVV